MELFKIVVVLSSLFAVAFCNGGGGGGFCPSPPSSNTYKTYKFPDECPSCPYVSNIDLDFLDGGWFQQFATVNGSQVGCDGDCVTMYGSIETETSNFLEYCCNAQGVPKCEAYVGSASLGQDSSHPKGVLTYRIFDQDFAECIVDIEYDVWFITYKCLYQAGVRTEIGEVWSRKRKMKAADKVRAFNKLNAIFIDKDLLMPIAQPSSCPKVFKD